MKKILVLGGSGLVGKAIIDELDQYDEYQVYGTYFNNLTTRNMDRSFKLDIEDIDNMHRILEILKPDMIVSCLRGDFKKQLALHTKIAEYLKKCKGRLYFCSTTNVFDNDLSKAHYEDDLVNSCTDYGQYKIKCEKIMSEILDQNACILRLPQVWGKDSIRMNNLKNALQNKEKISVFQRLSINTITDVMIAKKVAFIMEHDLKGIFHLGAEDIINHKDFMNQLIRGLGFNNVLLEENIEAEGYFALLSERDHEFPREFTTTHQSIIHYLLNK